MLSPWDSGLQNERTGLSWQRTMLSGLACSLLIARLLAGISLTLAVSTGLLALLGTAMLGWMAIRRFRQTSADLHAGRPVAGALPQLVITTLLVLTSVAAMIYLVIV